MIRLITVVTALICGCGCANSSASKKIVHQLRREHVQRGKFEKSLPSDAKWRCFVFIGALQHEQYIFSDGSALSVFTSPKTIGVRAPEDIIVKMDAE